MDKTTHNDSMQSTNFTNIKCDPVCDTVDMNIIAKNPHTTKAFIDVHIHDTPATHPPKLLQLQNTEEIDASGESSRTEADDDNSM